MKQGADGMKLQGNLVEGSSEPARISKNGEQVKNKSAPAGRGVWGGGDCYDKKKGTPRDRSQAVRKHVGAPECKKGWMKH